MTTLARIASALIAASALLFPLSAMAETKAPEGHRKGHESTYPMKADAFKKLVDGRIGQLKSHLDQGLEKRSLSPEQKAEIEKSMDGAIKDLHSAVAKVSSDGSVTRDEAKQIKDLSEHLRTKMRAELKGKHAVAKAKGAKPAKGKSKVKAAAKKAPKDGFDPKAK
jgi:archaellum component FlaC